MLCRIASISIVTAVLALPSDAQPTPAATYDELQRAFEAAQASASRPGDASLSCEALEGQLVAAVKHPAVQAFAAKSGAAAQEQMAAMNAASAGMASQMAMTMMSSIVPGGAWAGHAAAVASARAQQAQAARNIEQRIEQAHEMIGILPHIMRGQRVIELAQARDCAWLKDAMPR